MTESKQSQKAGDSSINIQAQNINVNQSLSYDDVKSISKDVFEANFLRLSGISVEIAEKRADELINNFLEILEERNPEALQNAANPDLQYAIFTAQKEYARTGDQELGEILVDILVDRFNEPDRNILQIVLNESLRIAPKLTKDQLSTLSVIFSLKYTKYIEMSDLSSLIHNIDYHISPFVDDITIKHSCYQHLEYTGCGSISIGSIKIGAIFKNNYPGLFSKGFAESEKETIITDNPSAQSMFIPCLHNARLLQIGAMDDEIIKSLATQNHLDGETTNQLIRLQNDFIMNEKEIEEYLKTVHPCMDKLLHVWENSSMKNTALTSVGIAIGHANTRRITKKTNNLSIWIN